MKKLDYKKNHFIKLFTKGIFIFSLILSFSSCDDYLDEVPDNRVALDDLEKAAQLLTNAYPISSYAFTDWMTDDVGYTLGVTIRLNQEQTYMWEDVTSDPTDQDTPIFAWFQSYEAVAHANEVLAVLNELPIEDDDDIDFRNSIESEARLTRAYAHFMLVNLFSKHYDESTASSDLGVPYVEEPETVFIKTYTRNTVQEVYDKVEEDMLKGIELLDDSYFANSGKYHFNRGAALAFASRFYLFKGDYENCEKYSTLLLGASAGSYVRDLTSDEFQAASSSITGYPQLYCSPDLPSNLLLIRKISLVQRTDFAHGPVSDIYNAIFDENPFSGTTDERENPAFVKGDNALFPVRYQSLFQRSSANSDVGFPYHIAMAFKGEEVLLNRVEANIFLNRVDEAIEDLQALADRRYSGADAEVTIARIRSFYGVTNNPNYSDRYILYIYALAERRKEFISQGLRWFDVKRLGIEVEHDLEDGSVITLESEDLRKVLQIPQSAIDVGGLRANPR
ncbi:RagB/SusD family nutrient uptake outer membrane protein [Chondrinema litorale]|uniref:RagB/SusD family nutrient uptake outer membrane protein n=1 Tax=Chondrinema litorale TaxID=2994555 RepID=UPI002542DAC4|nr:RagB/SusD family nutrient uptake outer membrane protein [Chondrinema litorale]UZR95519.1 RagB/SusD family nutrient uptake outer membrane protein [Chondrinema litorale]